VDKALDGGDVQMGKLSVKQLIDNISALENAYQYQSMVNIIAVVTSIAGLLLALVLALSLIVR
jgi:hypothetical protein